MEKILFEFLSCKFVSMLCESVDHTCFRLGLDGHNSVVACQYHWIGEIYIRQDQSICENNDYDVIDENGDSMWLFF